MFKLTIPSVEGFYSDVIAHDNVLRVVALSGGYTRVDSNEKPVSYTHLDVYKRQRWY